MAPIGPSLKSKLQNDASLETHTSTSMGCANLWLQSRTAHSVLKIYRNCDKETIIFTCFNLTADRSSTELANTAQ